MFLLGFYCFFKITLDSHVASLMWTPALALTPRHCCTLTRIDLPRLRAAMEAPSGSARVLNIARGEQTSVNTLAKTLARYFNIEAEIAYADARAGDIRHSAGDPSALQETLGVRAETTLDEGLRNLTDWLKSADN